MEKLWLKNKVACRILILIVFVCILGGCSKGSQKGSETAPSEESTAAASELSNETVESLTTMNDFDNTEIQREIEHKEYESVEDHKTEKMLRLFVNDEELSVTWENNESVEALKEIVSKEPLIIEMSMYGGFEQVGSIGQSLPRNDKQTTTDAGDIVLYSGNQIVIFYGSNSWGYTRLGHIEDRPKKELAQMLGEGNVSLTIKIDE